MKSKVYITQEAPYDFLPAQAFGEVIFLTGDDLSNIKGSLLNERLLTDIRHKLKKFDPHNDWIVVAGSPYIAAAVFMMLGRMQIRHVRLLRWSNQSRSYIPLHIEITPEVTA